MPKKLGSFTYPKIDGSITWFGSITDKRWYNLVALIRHIMKSNQKTSGHVIIKGFYGSKLTDLTNYTKLKCTLGCITVGYSDIETNLWNAIKIIKHKKGAFQFVILSFNGVVYFERKWKYFESFGKFSKEDLKKLSLQKLLNIWDNRHLINKHKPIKTAEIALAISHVCFVQFKFIVRDIYRIIIPAHVDKNLKSIQKMAYNTMISCGILHTIAKFISRRISVTTSYYSSIGRLMDNSKLAAKEFNIHFPPLCSCDIVSMLGKNTGTSLGHKWIKATEINTRPFNTIFEISGNSIPIPVFEDISFDITNQIQKLITNNFCDEYKIDSTKENCVAIAKKRMI